MPRRVQFVNVVAERDEAHAQRMQMMQERDEVIRLVEAREAARIRTVFVASRQRLSLTIGNGVPTSD
jgi:hypothetical protein